MPSNIKINRSYGRKNIQLLRLAIQSVMLFILLLIVIFIGLNVIYTAQDNSKNEKVNLEKKYTSEKLDEVQKTYEEFASNLNTVTQILSKQILYSSLLQKIGSVIPPGATLNSVSLASTDNALDMNFSIIDSALAPIIQVNLQDEKNNLFEKADIIQVSCQQDSLSSEKCTAQLKAQYKKDAVFLFINTIGNIK
jgi:hypothetical protein